MMQKLPRKNTMKLPTEESFFFNKLCRFCAYQERSEKEVRFKLVLLGCPENWSDGIVENLKFHGFLNEERFVKAFVSGKQNLKSWGKEKILQKLIEKGISRSMAIQSLNALDKSEYEHRLKNLIEKKYKLLANQGKDQPIMRLIKYGLSKGYSFADVSEMIKELGIK